MGDKPLLDWPPPLPRRPVYLRVWYGLRRFVNRFGRHLVLAAIIGGMGYYWYTHRDTLPPISEIFTPQIPEAVLPSNPFFDRPATAPNGSPWPESSSYIAGYPRLNVFGMADVVADNTGGSSDLFAKLIDRDQAPMKAVRVFFLRAKRQMTLGRVKPGHYDLRYMNLDTGMIQRTKVFEVTLKKTPNGEEYMGWTVGLYGVVDGTEHHEEISQSEF